MPNFRALQGFQRNRLAPEFAWQKESFGAAVAAVYE
jgi:hypothetical protein